MQKINFRDYRTNFRFMQSKISQFILPTLAAALIDTARAKLGKHVNKFKYQHHKANASKNQTHASKKRWNKI